MEKGVSYLNPCLHPTANSTVLCPQLQFAVNEHTQIKEGKLSSDLTYVCILLQHVQFVDNSEVKSFVLNQNDVCVCPHLYGTEYFR